MFTIKMTGGYLVLAFFSFMLLTMDVNVDAAPRYHVDSYYEPQEVPTELLMELLSRFQQTMMRATNDLENSKRTVDFGLARGYSGAQEARHRMGLAAANFPGGPGRRRRSDSEE